MSTRQKSGGGTIVVIVAAIAAFFAFQQVIAKTNKTQRPQHDLILSLVYIPMSPLKGEVSVLVKEGRKTHVNESHVGTPWAATIKVTEGSIVTFKSTKSPKDMMTMSCTIHDTDGHLHDQQDLQPGKQSVECKASV